MSVNYPIAATAEAALNATIGRAIREREARDLAGREVVFARDLVGPAFETREAALEAYAGRVDAEGSSPVAPEDRYCDLVEIAAPVTGRKAGGGQAEPVFEAGHRWPKPKRLLKTVWRLSVSYWRTANAPASDLPQARQARRAAPRDSLDATSLRAMAQQPLKPVKPQQPLDIGLFEVRPPDAPHIIMPDE